MTTAARETFTIEVDGHGVKVRDDTGRELTFTPVQALMFLDILREEEGRLRESADEACPLPLRIVPPRAGHTA